MSTSRLAVTTSASLGTAGSGGIIIWAFKCINAGTILVPEPETAMLMAGYIAPLYHAIILIIERKLNSGQPTEELK